MLVIDHLTKDFEGLRALDEVSFEAKRGEILGLIGPNGSGKTTLFNVVSGCYRPTGGTVFFKDERIDGLKPHQVSRKGLLRTFQIPQVFGTFTAIDTVMVAALGHLHRNEARKKAGEIMEIVGLAPKAHLLTGSLTAADHKILEVARALACKPEMILLDETLAGLTVVEAQAMIELIKRLQDEGITFIMVEHVMHIIMSLCPHIVVLNFGQKIAEGSPEDIAKNQDVVESYLGKGASFA